jgi:hypothetical protein
VSRDITLPAQRGPALYYVGSERGDGTDVVTRIDLTAVEIAPTTVEGSLRERALCRALLLHAIELLDYSEPVQKVVMGLEPGR